MASWLDKMIRIRLVRLQQEKGNKDVAALVRLCVLVLFYDNVLEKISVKIHFVIDALQ